jgi:general stress protein YciG
MIQDGLGSSSQEEKGKSRISNRGFASMSPEQQRQIASKGGQAAHKKGVAHEWTSEEARAAGKKGGQASKKGSKTSANENTDTEEVSRQADTGRTNVSQPLKENPDEVSGDEMNPQRQDTQQDRVTNR